MVYIGNDWDDILCDAFHSDYYLKLREFLKNEYKKYKVYPPMDCLFNALRYCSYKDTKVVILGQDPYHGYGQAHGLCFSVKEGVEFPPSLQNIFKELNNEYGIPSPKSGELTGWAKQGVLLLNTTLSVREGQPMSHVGHGWEMLTDTIISKINEKEDGVVFLLWGSHAKSKKNLINNTKHLILETVHPSPLSVYRGFFGCNHFIKANKYLESNNRGQIDWSKIND